MVEDKESDDHEEIYLPYEVITYDHLKATLEN